jgi:hypothetical protein
MNDLRFAFRRLLTNPVFTAMAAFRLAPSPEEKRFFDL